MLKLKGKNKTGKAILNKWGNVWEIIRHDGGNFFIKSVKDNSGDTLNVPESARWLFKNDKTLDVDSYK